MDKIQRSLSCTAIEKSVKVKEINENKERLNAKESRRKLNEQNESKKEGKEKMHINKLIGIKKTNEENKIMKVKKNEKDV